MGCKNVFHENGNQQKVDVAILTWNKTDFKIKSYKRQRRTLHHDQKIYPIRYDGCVNIYAVNIKVPECTTKMLTNLKGELIVSQ